MNRYILKIIIIIALLHTCEITNYAFNITPIDIKTNEGTHLYNSLLENKNNIRIVFVGDIMMSRDVEKDTYKNFYGNYAELFTYIKPFFNNADIVFGNLENPISDVTLNIEDNLNNILEHPVGGLIAFNNRCSSFNAELESLYALKWAGFNILNVANNHAGNAGIEGIIDTVYNLQKVRINYIGIGLNRKEAHKPYIFEKNGIKIGFLGYSDIKSESNIWKATYNRAGISVYNRNFVRQDILKTKNMVDLLIVALHFGIEFKTNPSFRQINIAHEIINSGANIVIGHHPHVIQPTKEYKDGLIVYSLGNFIFDQHRNGTNTGLLIEMFIDMKSNIYYILRTVNINEKHQPSINF